MMNLLQCHKRNLTKPYKIYLYQTASNTHLFFLYYIRFVFQNFFSVSCVISSIQRHLLIINFSMAILPRTLFGKNSWLWYQVWTEISIFSFSSWFRAEFSENYVLQFLRSWEMNIGSVEHLLRCLKCFSFSYCTRDQKECWAFFRSIVFSNWRTSGKK